MDFRLLFQDSYLALCEKPAGMPSQPDKSGRPDLLTALQGKFPYVGLVHRLDTPTGGIMAYSLDPAVTGRLSLSVQNHEQFVKEYLAVLPSPMEASSGELCDILFHDTRKNRSFPVSTARKGCKDARLTYRTLALSQDGHTLILVRLMTGRTHQIRVQFASRRRPLSGDGKYGSREKLPGMALWACRLTFPHPVTGTLISEKSFPDCHLFPWSCFGKDAFTLPEQNTEDFPSSPSL